MNSAKILFLVLFCFLIAVFVLTQGFQATGARPGTPRETDLQGDMVTNRSNDDSLFAEIDANKDGSLTEEEWRAAGASGSVLTEERRMRESSYKKKIQRALDYMEIQNVMAKHVYYFNAQKQWEELDDIWAKKADIAYGHNGGFKVGQESVRNYYGGMNERQRKKKLEIMSRLNPDIKNVKDNEGIGDLVTMPVQTPCIEIAGDGKTAKGVWFSNGLNFEIGADGKPVAFGFWGKFGVDFIKEDGKWKIWHFVGFDDVMWRYEESWVDKINPPLERTVPEDENWDISKDPPHQPYSASTLPQYDPKPPDPYETWDDSMSYLK